MDGLDLCSLKVIRMSRDWKPDLVRLHLKITGRLVRMSDWLFSKTPLEAAAVFKKAAKFVDLLATNNMFIVEGANPANWYVHEDSRLPIFVWPHFILTKQQN
jgi:hypothetical protein